MARSFETLVGLVETRAEENSDETAYVHLDQGEEPRASLTYAELERRAKSLAAYLQGKAAPGDRVLLVFPNGLEFIVAFFGCLFAGLIAVPVAPPRTKQVVARLLAVAASAQAKVVMTSAALRTELARRVGEPGETGAEWLFLEDIPDNLETVWRRVSPKSGDLAVLQFTSGSTGNPKGVQLSHANILHNCHLLELACGSAPDLRLVSWLPNFHDWGLIGCLMFPLLIARPSYTFDPSAFLFRPKRWLDAMSRFKGTLTCSPNFGYEMCIRQIAEKDTESLDLSAWNMAMVGAEPVRKATIERFVERFGRYGFRKEAFYPCYGLAESTLIVSGGNRMTPTIFAKVNRQALDRGEVVMQSASSTDEARDLIGCGHPIADQKVRIINPETKRACAPNEIGEIWISGPSVAQGYWNEPELSARTFANVPADETNARYLRTGDLGFLRDSELFICGRLKDVIIKAGHNHFAEDIEYTVARSHPALRADCCAAFGIDAAGAERLVIVQELDYGSKLEPSLAIGSIQQAISKEHEVMADAIAILKPGSLEKTSSGKVRRQRTKQMFLANELPTLGIWKSW